MIAAFLNNLVPYHHARWNAYARCQDKECLLIELTNHDTFSVLELDRGDAPAYQRITLFPNRAPDKISKAEMRRAVHRVLDEQRPEVVCLNGYSFAYNWAALDWSIRRGVPTIVCSESNEFDEPRQLWKESIKRLFIQHCTAGLAGGRPQSDYLIKLGLPKEQVFSGYDVVDNDHFAAGADAARSQRDFLQKKLSLPASYLLACSRFGRKKNLPLLIMAYAHYRKLAEKSALDIRDLVLIGDGEERVLIEKTIKENDLASSVHLLGAKPYQELPAYYGLASAFILASTTEQWGLVVNEAMASALPVLVSNRCGCAPDLVKEDFNGFTFDPSDAEDIAQKMLQISASGSQLSHWGNASREIIANWSPKRFAEGLSQAVDTALLKPARSTLLNRTLISILSHR